MSDGGFALRLPPVSFVICERLYLPLCQHAHMLQHCAVSFRVHGTRPCLLVHVQFITAPSAHLQLLPRRERPSSHLYLITKNWQTVRAFGPAHTHTHTHFPTLSSSYVGFTLISNLCLVWNGNTGQLMNAGFMWAVAYLNVSVWLMATSITLMSLFKIHQVTIWKSGSEEEVVWWTDMIYGRVASQHFKFSFGSPPCDKSLQHLS